MDINTKDEICLEELNNQLDSLASLSEESENFTPLQEENENLSGVESLFGENNSQEFAERNKTQKRIYINEDTINVIFGNGDEDSLNNDICYYKILNLCRKGITKYFRTNDFLQKEELAYICIMRLYKYFKKRLQKMKNRGEKPEVFFYMSRFYQYIDITARNVVGVHWRKEKDKSKFMEFKEGVNYSQSLDEILGHYEPGLLEATNKEEQKSEKIDKNKNEARCIAMNVSSFDLKQIHLDSELDKSDNEMNIDSFLNSSDLFDEDEKKLIKGVYLGYKKEDIFYNQFKKKVDYILSNLSSENAQNIFFISYDRDDVEDLKKIFFELTLSCAKRKYLTVLKKIRTKLEGNKNCLEKFLEFMEC